MLHFSSSLVILVASALLAAVCQCLYLLCRGTQNWRPCSRYSLTSEGGVITSLVLLAMPLQMQPSVRLAANAALCAAGCLGCKGHRSVMFRLLSTRLSAAFSAKLPSILSAPSLYWYVGLLHPSCRNTWGFGIDSSDTVSSTLNYWRATVGGAYKERWKAFFSPLCYCWGSANI